MFKRAVDLILSVFGILVLLPLFPIVALIIKLDSRGPIFYLCDRIGKDGQLFRMFKFRTMYTTPTNVGPTVCPEGDPRVTSVGRILRRTKINEFPQLMNILLGEMSFVGPRPEAPDLAALYPPQARAIFNVKPGLVGPSQIIGRNEEEWYPAGVDPQQYYIEVILPRKLPVDLEYIKNPSGYMDLKYIFLGGKETLCKLISWNLVLRNKSQIYLLISDVCLINIVALISYYSTFRSTNNVISTSVLFLSCITIIRVLCFLRFGLYSTLIRHLSLHDIGSTFKGVTLGSFVIIAIAFIFHLPQPHNISFLTEWIFLIITMSLIRTSLRLYWDWNLRSRAGKPKRVLIFGAGDAGVLAHRSLATEKTTAFEVIGFLDDDAHKRHKSLYGLKVFGGRHNLAAIVKLYQIDMIFLAIPTAPFQEVIKVINACQEAKIPYSIFPTLQAYPTPFNLVATSKKISELFITKPLDVDEAILESMIQSSSILVTGNCSELTIELCHQILKYSPNRIIVIDRYESHLNELVVRLRNVCKPDVICPVLCGTLNNKRITDIFREYQPDIIFHTSTRKYTPSFEIPIEDILRSNYISTFELAKHAARFKCKYFVMLSSLATAKNENLVYGSLRAAEISLKQFFSKQQTKLAVIRLCDIVENRGSIVSLLKSQIENLEPITIPHSYSSCSLISKHSAVKAILANLLNLKHSDTHTILDSVPGISIPLVYLAQKMSEINGLKINSDILINFSNSESISNSNKIDLTNSITAPSDDNSFKTFTISNYDTSFNEEDMTDAINYLLNMKESDLDFNTWKDYTHTIISMNRE